MGKAELSEPLNYSALVVPWQCHRTHNLQGSGSQRGREAGGSHGMELARDMSERKELRGKLELDLPCLLPALAPGLVSL